jgi:hypothetical protein
MFYWLFFIKNILMIYRIALHFLKLPEAASPGVIALAQELTNTTTHSKMKRRVIIGRVFFYKSKEAPNYILSQKRSKRVVNMR